MAQLPTTKPKMPKLPTTKPKPPTTKPKPPTEGPTTPGRSPETGLDNVREPQLTKQGGPAKEPKLTRQGGSAPTTRASGGINNPQVQPVYRETGIGKVTITGTAKGTTTPKPVNYKNYQKFGMNLKKIK